MNIGTNTNKQERIQELERVIEEKQNEWASTDAIQYSLKIMLNSFYGIYSNEYFRYFDLRLAAAVTSLGQVAIRGPRKYLEEKIPDMKVEYMDTDSLFVSLKKLLDKHCPDGDKKRKREVAIKISAEAILPTLETYYDKFSDCLNAYKNTYEMDFETIADNTIFVGKKRYIMNQVYKDGYNIPIGGKPDLKVKGVEIVRTSTPLFIRKEIRKLVEQALIGNENNKCIELIDKMKTSFSKSNFEKVAFPRTANNVSKFNLGDKSLPIHIRGSLIYNKAIKDLELKVEKIQNGSKVRFCYIKEPNYFHSNIIACPDKMPKQLLKQFEIDYEKQFDKSAMAPIKLIFDALQWQTERIATLDGFFDD